MHAEHQHDEKAAEPQAVRGQEDYRLVPSCAGEPIIAVWKIDPLWILPRQPSHDETHKGRHTDEKTQHECQITVAAHPAIGAVIGTEMGSHYLRKISSRVDDEGGRKHHEANQRHERAVEIIVHQRTRITEIERMSGTIGSRRGLSTGPCVNRLTTRAFGERSQGVGCRALAFLGNFASWG